jgi:hypothetical protein
MPPRAHAPFLAAASIACAHLGLLVPCASTAEALAGPDAALAPPPAIETGGMPPVPADLAERLLPYSEVRSARFVEFSPDGKSLLVSTRFGDAAQLHLVHAREGRREQITFEAEPVGGGAFVPRDPDGRLLFSMSRGARTSSSSTPRRPSRSSSRSSRRAASSGAPPTSRSTTRGSRS